MSAIITLDPLQTATFDGVYWNATVNGTIHHYGTNNLAISSSYLNGALSGGEASFVADDSDLDYSYAILSTGTTAAELVEVTAVSGTTYTASVVSSHSDGVGIMFLHHVELMPEWFGATGTSDDAAFSALATAVNVGGGTIVLNGAQTYAEIANVAFTKSVTIHGNGATISADGTDTAIEVNGSIGSYSNLDSNAGEGESHVTCAAFVGSVAIGDLVKIISDEDASTNDATEDVNYGEIHCVAGTSGNDIEFETGLFHDYTTANTARIALVTAPKVAIYNLNIEQTLADTSRGVTLAYCDTPVIEHVSIDNAKSRAFYLEDCYRPRLVGYANRNIHTSNGYGVMLSNATMYADISGVFMNCRHGFTTGGNDNHGTVWAAHVHNATFGGTVEENEGQVVHTHATYAQVKFTDVIAVGGDKHDGTAAVMNGYGFEGGDITIEGCMAIGCNNAVSITSDDLDRFVITNLRSVNCARGITINSATVDEFSINGYWCYSGTALANTAALEVAGSTIDRIAITNMNVYNMMLLKIGTGNTLPNDITIDGFTANWAAKQAIEEAIEIRDTAAPNLRFINGYIEKCRYGFWNNAALDNVELINVIFEDTTYPIDIDAAVGRLRVHGCKFGTLSSTVIINSAQNFDCVIVSECVAEAAITNLINITGTWGTFHHGANEWAGNVTNLISGGSTQPLEVLGGDELFGGVHRGNGAPSHSAAKGTIYQRLDGAANTLLYVNTDGAATWNAYA